MSYWKRMRMKEGLSLTVHRIEKKEVMAKYTHFFQIPLPTELVVDSLIIPPEQITFVRAAESRFYVVEGVKGLMSYEDMQKKYVDPHLEKRKRTLHIEMWEDWGSDGHVDWRWEEVALVSLDQELHEYPGVQLQWLMQRGGRDLVRPGGRDDDEKS